MTRTSVALAAGLLLAACGGPFRLEAPAGFARVEDRWDEARFKATDNVGLRIDLFTNSEGGTLAYWAKDLAVKLHRRGYVLREQRALSSGNGVAGTQFEYSVKGKDGDASFFVVGLFVSDKYRFVLQLAGDEASRGNYVGRMDEFADALRLRGCETASKVCRGPQPPDLQATLAKLETTDR